MGKGQEAQDGILEAIRALAEAALSAPVLLAPGRNPLARSDLLALLEETRDRLRGAGIGPTDRVATVLPEGPEAAAAFLAVASSATAAPLNPAYGEAELDFFLSDLRPRAVVVPEGADSPAGAVARRRGIPVLRLAPREGGPAGGFVLRGTTGLPAAEPRPADPGDVALVLHTSGTTSRPKVVPLLRGALVRSARNVAESLRLDPADRCLVVMPLFHVHGLVGSLLSSVLSGGSAVCAPGFHAARFLDWAEECAPTWTTAVPTMHQGILRHAAGRRPPALRLVRSCSSALPPTLMAEMERFYGAPVVEAYGMTEAAHQVASNPLPPGDRKPGSVGIRTGCEIAVRDGSGRLLPAGSVGEVVIRGPSVVPGYADNPDANAGAFADGWFRTGDEGRMDGDGYLFLTGRTKEIINRGGEKISPREVDEALLSHPAVLQAVAFAVPDGRLGEEVAAAVVVREGSTVGEAELRRFAAARLAAFKVPRTIVLLREIPKGPTGKVQRIGLAERLGIRGNSGTAPPGPVPLVPPSGPSEARLLAILQEALRTEGFGTAHRFADLGVDSMTALLVAGRAAEEFGIELTVLDLFDHPTVAALARLVDGRRAQR